MSAYYEMFRKYTASSYYNQINRFAAPLCKHLGISHFWYYRITHEGLYSYFGSHAKWSEFSFENNLLGYFPCLRHPNVVQSSIELMKADIGSPFERVRKVAWDKFKINFSINLVDKTAKGIEAFGFASCTDDMAADVRLLNELSLLRQFIQALRLRYPKLFDLLEDYQIDLAKQIGPAFYKAAKNCLSSEQRNALLSQFSCGSLQDLTPRQVDILKWISHGYPASYIADQLSLNTRTVENYLAAIKDKLGCSSKVELIQKAQQMCRM